MRIFDTIFTNKEFDKILEFENHNLKITKVNDTFEVSFKLTNSINVFVHYHDDIYYASFNGQKMNELFGEDNVERKYEFFSKMILKRKGIEFINVGIELYTVDIKSKEGQHIFNNWKSRYENLIKSIPQNELIIELSAGIDTRTLSYFYRNLHNTYIVYSKNDPDEVNEALNVIEYINENFPVSLNATHNKQNEKITLNGGSLIHGLYRWTTAGDFLHRINNYCYCHKSKHIVEGICPFYDKEYLKLRGSFPGYVKVYTFFELCAEKDLYKLQIKSFKRSIVNIDDLRKLI